MTTPVKQTISQFLSVPQTQSFLEESLKEKKGEFISNLIALSDSNPALAGCDPAQLMKCCLNATALNLPLNNNLGYAYVIPYKGIPSFQIGYKGLIQMAIRTGAYKTLNAVEIREGEIMRNKITGVITFIAEKPDNKIIGYLAFLELLTGFSSSIYMTEKEIDAHAKKYSQVYKADVRNKTRKSKWSDPDERPKMARKTVMKKLLGTYGVMTTEHIKAMEVDSDNEQPAQAQREYTEAEVVPQEDPTEQASEEKKEDGTPQQLNI